MKGSFLTASDLKLWRRLLLVALTGAVPLLIVSVVLIKTSYNNSINFILQEERGIAFQRPLEELLDLVPLYQAAARESLAGDVSAVKKVNELRRLIDADMAVVASNYQGDLGRALGFNDAQLALRRRDNARLVVLQEDWNKFKAAPPTVQARGESANQMLDSLRAMIVHAGDLSNLILDSKLDSYYLMHLTVCDLPQAQQRLSDITLQVGDWLRNGTVEANRTQIFEMVKISQQDDLDRITTDAQTLLTENANSFDFSPSLQKNLPPALASYTVANRAFFSLLDRIAAGEKVSATEFEKAGWNASAESDRLFQVGADELNQLLAIRIHAIEIERWRDYGIIGLTLIFAACIMGWIVRNLLRTRYAEMLGIEEELRSKEARLRALSDNLPNGMVYQVLRELDSSMRFLYVSAGIERLNGLSAEAVMQDFKLFQNQIFPEDLSKMNSARLDSLEGNKTFNVVVRVRRNDGAVRWMQLCSAPRPLPDGRCIWDGIETDITERQEAEAALIQSEERFSRMFNSAPLPISLVRLEDGLFIDANESFFRMSGFTREETIGHTSLELKVYPDPGRRAFILEQIREHGHLHRHEQLFRTKTGQIRTHLLWLDPIFINDEKCLLVVALDITENKRTQEEIMWKTAFLEAQVDSSLDGILVMNEHAKRILQNERLFQLFKVPEEIARDEDDSKLLQHMVRQVVNPGQFGERVAHLYAHPDEIGRDEIKLVDGGVLERYSAPVRDKSGKYYGRIWTFREMTEQVKLESQLRQAQKMEAIGQLAGGVAHDFNNILAVIMMQAGLMTVEKGISERLRNFSAEIEKAAQRASNLTRQLLLFSRQQAMQPNDFDLNEIVTNMVRMLHRILGEDVQMQFKLSSVPLMIRADAGMIDQILLNLTVNARDAMPTGGRLIVETYAMEFDQIVAAKDSQARPGSFVCMSVTDTGCGIPLEIFPRIFEPFFTTKDVGKGTGLGLATVFGIVQQHQGWINVYSEVGQGTTFKVYLPRLAGPAEEKVSQPSLAAIRGGSETILLLEDDNFVRSSVHNALVSFGYRVLEAATGQEALEVWKKHSKEIHLLLTDLVLPGGMTGKELADRLLQDDPKLKIIYSSGYSAEIASKHIALEEGVNFLPKPFETRQLAQTIRNRLDTI